MEHFDLLTFDHNPQSIINLAVLMQRKGDFEQARQLLNQALAIRRHLLPGAHTAIGENLINIGDLLHESGDHGSARASYGEALAVLDAAVGAQHWWVHLAQSRLGTCLREDGEADQARRPLQEAFDGFIENFGTDDERTIAVARELAAVYEQLSMEAEAAAVRERVKDPDAPD